MRKEDITLNEIKKLAQAIVTEHENVINRYINSIKFASTSVDFRINHKIVFDENTEAWNIKDSLTTNSNTYRNTYGYGVVKPTDNGKESINYRLICPHCGRIVKTLKTRRGNLSITDEFSCPSCKTKVNIKSKSNVVISGDTIFYTPHVILRIPYSFSQDSQDFYDFCIEIQKPRENNTNKKSLIIITYIAKHSASADSIIRENYEFEDSYYSQNIKSHGMAIRINSELKGNDNFDVVFNTSLSSMAIDNFGNSTPSTVKLLYIPGSFNSMIEKSGLAGLAKTNKLAFYTKAVHPDLTLFSRILRGDFLLEYLIKNNLFNCLEELDKLSSTNIISRKDIMSILKICRKNNYDYPFVFKSYTNGNRIIYSQDSINTLVNYTNYDGTPSEYRQGSQRPLNLYIDYLKLLIESEKDIKSPRWICPGDLIKSHDNLAEKLNKRINEIKLKMVKEQWEDFYENHILPYKNIRIELGDFIITPQLSIDDVYMMGTSFHNCVFNSGYFKNEYSILLKGYSKSTGKYETCIELVDGSRWSGKASNLSISQCYGPCNKLPDNNDIWMEMLKKSIPYINNIYLNKNNIKEEDRYITIKSNTVTGGEIKIQY